MRTLLIDGDIIAFTVAARVEQKFDWGDDVHTRTTNLAHAKFETGKWLDEIMEATKANKAVIALSDPGRRYFRHDIYPDYKLDRTHGQTPLCLMDIKDWLRESETFKTMWRPKLEADDIMGILGSHPSLVPGEKVIVTADKDLDQIAGLHFNPRKAAAGISEIVPAQAERFFYTQTLTGDPTDGFPGCPGIGPVKAGRILEDAYTVCSFDPTLDLEAVVWSAIVAAYAAKNRDEKYALTQARVARILRWTDYDYLNKQVKLWSPLPTSETSCSL